MSRRQARELAMKALFARDVGQGRPRDALAYLAAEEGAGAEAAAHAAALVDGVTEHLVGTGRCPGWRPWTATCCASASSSCCTPPRCRPAR